MKRRVVVTGLGTVTPLGNDLEETWSALLQGRSGVSRITLFDPSEFTAQIAGEVKGFNPEDFVDRREARRMDRFTQFAVASSLMAFKDSALQSDQVDPQRMGVIIGVGLGGIQK